MDGSLFFRAVTAVMVFFRDIMAGSYIAKFFIGEYNEPDIRASRYAYAANQLFNGLPKIFTAPVSNKIEPKGLTRLLSGSWLVRTACEALDTPIPNNNTAVSWLRWFLYALPIWGLLAVVAAAAFLPTMLLAGMLAVVFVCAV
jgi:hypothetical protein